MNRLLKKFIGLLATLTPNTFYYNKVMEAHLNKRLLALATKRGGKTSMVTLGCLTLICSLSEEVEFEVDDELIVTMNGITDAGREVGSYKLTIRRTE